MIALGATACAAIAGVDQFSEGACAGGDCDGAVIDSASDVPQGVDAPFDAPRETSGGDASGTDASDASDGGASDASDASKDAAKDAPSDAGGDCGPDLLNCTACGASCDVIHSNPTSCNGATCVYSSCHSGWTDCSTTAPNLDGCECNTPACCGSKCETTHANGVGQNYYDCVDAGTYNVTQATEACAAYTGNQAACSSSGCTGPGSNMVVCGSSGNLCVCWNYSGTNVGHLYSSGQSTCYCPGSTDPSWN